MKKLMMICVVMAFMLTAPLITTVLGEGHSVAHRFGQDQTLPTAFEMPIDTQTSTLSISVDSALFKGAEYLRHAQADITEDNAGNGDPDVPDDPDDGGWDWVLTSPAFTHSTTASPPNIYGATAMGLYYAYMRDDDASHMTALEDAANQMEANASIRSAADLVFLMRFQDIPGVTADIYKEAAKAKFDARIETYGSATAFAETIRNVRAGQGYENGIIPWDIGIWAVAAQMLADRYQSDPLYDYAQAADDIAEVIYQDSFEQNPGYFDLTTDKNSGWDPTYSNRDYYWYTLGITGLIDAFITADVHTDKISGLVAILLECQFDVGAFSYCYGANGADKNWQSTAYAVMSLARVNQVEHQDAINRATYWLASTQDSSGGWVYPGGNHYPEIGGECTAALYFMGNPDEVWVDDDYSDSSCGDHLWGYDAFDDIPAAIAAVANGGTVNVASGFYTGESIDKMVNIAGKEDAVVNDGPVHPSGLIQGFLLLAGSDGTTISHLGFIVDLAIYNGAGCDDVTVDHCIFNSPLQALSNWNGSGWNISHNVINGLRTKCGGGIGIFIGTRGENVSANDNLIAHNTITGEVMVPGDDCGGYSTPGIGLMSDRRWERPAGPMEGNRIIKNKVNLFITVPDTVPDPMECHGIELTDLGLYEDPPGADLKGNQAGFNDVRGVVGIPIALYPIEVVEENEIERNLGVDIPNYGDGFEVSPSPLAPFGPQ